jgi:hypothetical protein
MKIEVFPGASYAGPGSSALKSGMHRPRVRCIQARIGRIPSASSALEGAMRTHRSVVFLLTVASLGFVGGSARASVAKVSEARTAEAHPAQVSFTVSHPVATQHVHRRLSHLHRRHGHAQPVRNLVARHTTPTEDRAPMPAHPRRGHRSATVPHVVHRVTVPRSMKGGSNTAMALSSAASGAEEVRMLSRARSAAALASDEHPILSGRGPPRASPLRLTLLAPSFPSAPVAPRPLSFFAPRFFVSTLSIPSITPSDAMASRCLVVDRGSLLGRLHVRRLEGAATCFEMPSAGGSPCFA